MPLNGEMKAMADEKRLSKFDIDGVKVRMVTIRGQMALLDRDVAELYGVATREINQAVRNNPGKFPEGFVVQMSESEFSDWRSKILILDDVREGCCEKNICYGLIKDKLKNWNYETDRTLNEEVCGRFEFLLEGRS